MPIWKAAINWTCTAHYIQYTHLNRLGEVYYMLHLYNSSYLLMPVASNQMEDTQITVTTKCSDKTIRLCDVWEWFIQSGYACISYTNIYLVCHNCR